MEMNTQTKSFLLLLLTPCLALFICQSLRYLSAFSQPWKEVLPAPPANTVMIAGASKPQWRYPDFVRTKDGQYYHFLIESRNNNKEWKPVEKVNKEAQNNLLAGKYDFIKTLILFLFNRPPGTVIDHFYTEHIRIESTSPRYAVYYVLLDGGTLWSWSDPHDSIDHIFLNLFSVTYAVIVFVVTGVILLVMNSVRRPLPFRKQNQLFFLMFISLFIGFTIYIIFMRNYGTELFYFYKRYTSIYYSSAHNSPDKPAIIVHLPFTITTLSSRLLPTSNRPTKDRNYNQKHKLNSSQYTR